MFSVLFVRLINIYDSIIFYEEYSNKNCMQGKPILNFRLLKLFFKSGIWGTNIVIILYISNVDVFRNIVNNENKGENKYPGLNSPR